MGTIILRNDSVDFQTADQALEIVKAALPDENEFWIKAEHGYPEMGILVKGGLATIQYQPCEDGEILSSYNSNGDEWAFISGFFSANQELEISTDAIVGTDDMLTCVYEFAASNAMPTSIQWQYLSYDPSKH